MTDLEIYQAYPRKIARTAALKAISKAVRELARTVGEPEARRAIYEAARAFAASPAGNAGKFTPYPASWFNAGRYMDDPAEWWAGEEMPRFEPGIYRGPEMPTPSDEEVSAFNARQAECVKKFRQELRGRIQ